MEYHSFSISDNRVVRSNLNTRNRFASQKKEKGLIILKPLVSASRSCAAVAVVAAPPRILPPVHQINGEQVHRGSCAPLRAGCCPAAEPHPKSRALNSIKLVLRRSQFSRIFKAAPLTWTRRKPQGLQTWPGAKLCDVSLVCRETSKLEVL